MTQIHTKLIRSIFLPLMATASLWSAEPFADNFCQKPELNIPQAECDVLHDFWDATGGSNWNHQDGWGVDTNVSNWYGITLTTDSTNGKKSVYELESDTNNLTIMPSFKTLDLRPLTKLDTLYLRRSNLTELPVCLKDLPSLRRIMAPHNKLHNPLPDLSSSQSLRKIILWDNNYSGTISCDSFPQNIEEIILNDNHYAGSIPSCLNNFTHLTELYFSDNNLSGPLPDLSALTQLTTLHLEHNQFTFADFEPQINRWLGDVSDAWYVDQMGHFDGASAAPYYPTNYNDPRRVCHDYYVDERDHVVYFDDTLRIEPRVPANTYSDHDYFAWFKENGTDEGQLLENGGQRIYLKEDANASDEGYYYYEANNSVVTAPETNGLYTDLTYCSTPRTDGIHAIHDAAPRWGNAALPEGVATVDVTYRYDSTIRDDDADDTLSVTLSGNPGWLSLEVTDGNFTLSGTPQTEDAGKEYNLTLTLTDGKLPQTRHWLLHVNTADLPNGITHEGETYTHDATHTTVQAPHAWISTPADDTLRFTYPCEHTATAYAALTGGGVLTSGYRNCETNATTPTLQGSYPAGTILTLSPEMIEADVNLSTTITMGEH